MGLRGSQTEACFCFPYNALGCFCFFLVGYSCDTWPKASCSYKAIIIWCCSYIFWLRCAELLSACSSRLLQGTNWHRVCSGIRSCCFGLSGEAEQTKLCNHPSPVPPFPSSFHLLSFWWYLSSQMPHEGTKDMIREMVMTLVFCYSWCLENTHCHWRKLQDAKETRTCPALQEHQSGWR